MYLTLTQAKALTYRDTVYSLRSYNKQGDPHKVRINGAVKTWKRDPSRVQVPYKHGLYTFGYITDSDLHEWTLSEQFAKDQRK
jgi:hypothetical protein